MKENVLSLVNSQFFFSIAPGYTDAIVSLANVLSLQGNYKKLEALELLKKAAKLKPTDSDILNNLASLLSTLGQSSMVLYTL